MANAAWKEWAEFTALAMGPLLPLAWRTGAT
jgi:hypothetical protein